MFNDVKHISFDVWNTLITPNKEYSKVRNEAIAGYFGVSVDEAKAAYKHCKTFLDNTAELVGFGMSALNNWKLLEKTLGKSSTDLRMVMAECNVLFGAYQPSFDNELKEELIKLKERGYTLSIKSNTNFITGNLLSDVLFNDLNVFMFQHYSDIVEIAKPHHDFFELTSGELYNNHETRSLESTNILHIGDNLITDGKCKVLGWNFQYVQNPQDLLNKLKSQEIV